MESDPKSGRVTASVEEVALYNMMLTEAIFELLSDKGILTAAEVKERVQKLKAETHLSFSRLQ